MRFARNLIFPVAAGLAGAIGAAEAQQDAPPETEEMTEEIRRILACDRELCGIVMNPGADGMALKCDLSITWKKDEIAKAVEKGRLSWPFGDASCGATLKVSRTLLADAMKRPAYTLSVPPQPVSCEVENDGSRHKVTGRMAPVIEFKDRKATSVSLGLQDIKGNAIIRNVVWAGWKFESYFGYFQEDFVKGVNDYVEKWCPNRDQWPE